MSKKTRIGNRPNEQSNHLSQWESMDDMFLAYYDIGKVEHMSPMTDDLI